MPSLQEHIASVHAAIAAACARAHRPTDRVRLIAVTKTVPLAVVREAIVSGITALGENKAQEMATKFPVLTGVEKHFIGHLQSNKVKLVVEHCDWIHSVDSEKLLAAISAEAVKQHKQLRVLLEVNFYHHLDSAHRTGFEPKNIRAVLETAQKLPNLHIAGFMVIPLPDLAEPQIRHVFQSLRILHDAEEAQTGLTLPELSMGMSDDYPIAIEEGATMVRIGSAIFGARQ